MPRRLVWATTGSIVLPGLAVCLVTAVVAQAQSATTVLMIDLMGKCWLKVDGKELPCAPRMMNPNYADGRTGLYIMTDNAAYTWSGATGLKPDANSQVLRVDRFIATVRARRTWPAKGTYYYQNPYQGTPTTLSCEATYGKQVAEFRFEHDGYGPSSMRCLCRDRP